MVYINGTDCFNGEGRRMRMRGREYRRILKELRWSRTRQNYHVHHRDHRWRIHRVHRWSNHQDYRWSNHQDFRWSNHPDHRWSNHRDHRWSSRRWSSHQHSRTRNLLQPGGTAPPGFLAGYGRARCLQFCREALRTPELGLRIVKRSRESHDRVRKTNLGKPRSGSHPSR